MATLNSRAPRRIVALGNSVLRLIFAVGNRAFLLIVEKTGGERPL